MVECHEEQTQDEPFQNHEKTLAKVVTDTDMPHTFASPAGEVEIINLPTSARIRLSDNEINTGTEEDTDDVDHDKLDSSPTSNEIHGEGWWQGRGAAGRGRGRSKKNRSIRLNLDPASRPSASTATTTTTTIATTPQPM
ncbi:hypothetical protein PIB30_009974 [Stylosanthes scabra]|uniref:Uncharacterized protein n=1 Tax=Stylosanthes scabra TaxID=79078 RepID=A0ABU6U419_9FABA|nr:hypothetical protein [Stylosanthes scabra]